MALPAASSGRRSSSSQFRRRVQGRAPQLPARAGVAGRPRPAAPGGPRRSASTCEPTREPADADRIHRSLLAGLLSHIGMWDGEKREYLGARQARFAIGRRSALGKAPPRWVMAAELVETNRLWARTVARIQPEWVERARRPPRQAQLRRAVVGRAAGAAMADERVTLYGLPIVAARRVNVGRVDPGARPRAVHPPRPGRGRLGDVAPASSAQRGRGRRGAGPRGPGPAPRPPRRRRRASSTSTTRASRPTSSPAGTSTAGGATTGRPSPTCSTSPPRSSSTPAAGAVSTGRLPRQVGARATSTLAAALRFEPDDRARRRHRRHPPRRARPASTAAASTGRCPATARSW